MWKQIEDFPNYEVSDLGEVRNIKLDMIMSLHDNGVGYLQVKLRNCKGRVAKYVHRLVAEAFLPNSNPELEVHHKDHDKTNNSVENLTWVTKSENIKYANSFHKKREVSICAQCGCEYEHKKSVKRLYCSSSCVAKKNSAKSINEFIELGTSFIIWAVSNYPMTYLAKLCSCSDNGLRKRILSLLGYIPNKLSNGTNRPDNIGDLYSLFEVEKPVIVGSNPAFATK